MHAKTDSDGTSQSLEAASMTWQLRPAVYYVQSPSNHDALEKMSYGSSPTGSPAHPHNQNQCYYHSSPIHHSRESSTSRFSSANSLKNPRGGGPLFLSSSGHVRLGRHPHDGGSGKDDDDDDEDGYGGGRFRDFRVYLCGLLVFVAVFGCFGLILWGASKAYDPEIFVKDMVFENLNVQAGNDQTGVPTDMLSLNSTVKIRYRNTGTFFAVHVTSTPLELHYSQLKLASGQMEKFSQSRKSHRTLIVVVQAHQVPLYGGVPPLVEASNRLDKVSVPMNLTFVMRSRAYILGRLVKSKFYKHVRCSVNFSGSKLGKPLNLTSLCQYS